VTAEQVVDAALQGHRRAGRIVREAGSAIGLAVANAVTLLNLDRVILGGSVAHGASRMWLPAIRRDVNRLALEPSARHAQVSIGALGEIAGLVGAAWVFLQRSNYRTSV
jgi:predicted NBD/HSP70 family sugar kinase